MQGLMLVKPKFPKRRCAVFLGFSVSERNVIGFFAESMAREKLALETEEELQMPQNLLAATGTVGRRPTKCKNRQ